MSAIMGVYFFDGCPRPDLDSVLRRMSEQLAHRGPDGREIWNHGYVGLGHCMLRTTSESLHEKLPFQNSRGDMVLTADARIDNRDELIACFKLKDRDPGTISDSELILKAYEAWGERCAERLLGDFVFALWDEEQRQLFCARDHFGVKPLYYYLSDRLFVFASEIKALACLEEVPRRLNETMVGDYLLWCTEDKDSTFYKDIHRLRPACCVKIKPNRISFRHYWALNSRYQLHLRSNEEYAERFQSIFTAAVRCRLRSASSVGSLLGDGPDSSSVVSTAMKCLGGHGGETLHTFSAVFENETDWNQRTHMEEVIKTTGVHKAHWTVADHIPVLDDYQRIYDCMDELLVGVNPTLFWSGLYQTAREQHVRVLLDGEGSDETVYRGHAHLVEMAMSGRWKKLWISVSDLSRRMGQSPARVLWQRCFRSMFPEFAHRAWRSVRWGGRPPWVGYGLLRPDFSKRIRLLDRAARLMGDDLRPPRTSLEEHWRELNSGSTPYSLEMLSHAQSWFSIEPRYPFLDKRLVEFCLAIPGEQKLGGEWDRVATRRALNGVSPKTVRWRNGETSFGEGIARRFFTCHLDLVKEVLDKKAQFIEAYVDINILRRRYESFAKHPTFDGFLFLWPSVTLALWLERKGLQP